jgi:hypothetical protein
MRCLHSTGDSDRWVGSNGTMMVSTGKLNKIGRNPMKVAFMWAMNLTWVTQDRTLGPAVWRQCLTTWAMATASQNEFPNYVYKLWPSGPLKHTLRCRALLYKVAGYSAKNSLLFIETEGSSPYSQKHITGPSPEPHEPNSRTPTTFISDPF